MSQSIEVVETVCTVCALRCGVLAHIADGRITKIEPDRNSRLQGSSFCPIGAAVLELIYHPDRVKYPLKRVGARGSANWQQITWDEALDTLTQKLNSTKETYGAESVAFIQGMDKHFTFHFKRLANMFGSPNLIGSTHVCHGPTELGSWVVHGFYAIPDIDYPPACIIWAGRRKWPLDQVFPKTTKFIVIDPVENPYVKRAELWLQLRPATDLALALGMINVIINEELYDKDFVDKWTIGFDKLREHVQQYPPDKVEKITWVPAEKIVAASRLFATSKPARVKTGNAIEDNVNSAAAAQAYAILRSITGNLDVPGGDLEAPVGRFFNMPPRRDLLLIDKVPKNIYEKRIRTDAGLIPLPYPKFPMIEGLWYPNLPQHCTKAILEEDPYAIKVALVLGANPLLTWSNAKETYRAFNKLDFLAVMDFMMTPTAAIADIVLPAATCFEEDGIVVSQDSVGLPTAQATQKLIQVGECRTDIWVINELARRLGIGEHFPEDNEHYVQFLLGRMGMTFDEFKREGVIEVAKEFRKYERKGFNTPSGKVELYSSLFEDWGHEPLPTYHEPPETPYSDPDLAKEYPLILTCHHEDFYTHSQFRQLLSLRKLKAGPLTEIHPKTARRLGIRDGDSVYIETKRGRIRQQAVLKDGIDPRVVMLDYGWWFPEKGTSQLYGWDESNINILTDNKPPFNPQSGSSNLKGLCCKVYKAKE